MTGRILIACVAVLAQLHLAALCANSQPLNAPCDYDHENPTLLDAEDAYLIGNIQCATEIVSNLLARDNLAAETKSKATGLRAVILHVLSEPGRQRDSLVLEELRAAIRADSSWTGPSYAPDEAFDGLIARARADVERETILPVETTVESKAWHQRTWVRAVGGGVVVALIAALLSKGGGGDGDLPDPPNPPGAPTD